MPDGRALTAEPATDFVQARQVGNLGVITLTRPKALNALTTTMVEALDRTLRDWKNAGLRAVMLDSGSPKAFCAGGDIRAIREHALAGDHQAAESFFAAEYDLNHRIASYPVPVISLIDGICMGGGMGLSVHGTFRVISDKASLSMPETAIGFFPDVGASYFLPRLPGAIGAYLGLTGTRISAADALYCGLATHYIETVKSADILEALAATPHRSLDAVLLDTAARCPLKQSALAVNRSEIDWCFGTDSVAEVDRRLSSSRTEWAAITRKVLAGVSPQSLELTAGLLSWGRQRSLRECLDAELALTREVIRTHDFAEGVRAVLVDKDRSPNWGQSAFGGFDNSGQPRWCQE